MRCLELSIFYRCVNDCRFCSNTAAMREFEGQPLSLEEIAGVLEAKRREGYAHVTFTGGEPTLHPGFCESLRLAKRLGYRTQAISNGAALSLASFARAALPYLDELCLSVHGSEAGVHDALTLNDRSFERMTEALAHAAAYAGPLLLIVNTVATRLNVDDLPRIAERVCSYGRVRQLWVSSLIPEGAAAEGYSELAARFSEILGRAPRIAEAARRGAAELRFFGFPACALGPYRSRAAEPLKQPSVAVSRARGADGRPALKEADGRAEGPARVHTARCGPCRLKGSCPGLWERYLREFGDGELEAVLA